jgi:hypothetical protein
MSQAYNEDANAYNKPTLFGEPGRWNSSPAPADGSLPRSGACRTMLLHRTKMGTIELGRSR